jgi:hypothetical protein
MSSASVRRRARKPGGSPQEPGRAAPASTPSAGPDMLPGVKAGSGGVKSKQAAGEAMPARAFWSGMVSRARNGQLRRLAAGGKDSRPNARWQVPRAPPPLEKIGRGGEHSGRHSGPDEGRSGARRPRHCSNAGISNGSRPWCRHFGSPRVLFLEIPRGEARTIWGGFHIGRIICGSTG